MIVVVEDPFVGKYLQTLLLRQGYDVLPAGARRGLELLRSRDVQVDLLITNNPNAFIEFAEYLPVLYLAAFPDMDLAARFRKCRALQKPFLAAQLLSAVGDLVVVRQA